jgi:hypothetical protein
MDLTSLLMLGPIQTGRDERFRLLQTHACVVSALSQLPSVPAFQLSSRPGRRPRYAPHQGIPIPSPPAITRLSPGFYWWARQEMPALRQRSDPSPKAPRFFLAAFSGYPPLQSCDIKPKYCLEARIPNRPGEPMTSLVRISIAGLGSAVVMLFLSACAFQPRQVDVQAVEGRIAIPDVDYQGQYAASFLPVIDARPSKVDFGVGRNKMMMVTTSVSMKGDLASTMEKLVQKNFQAVGITNGSGPPTVKGKIIEAYTDANGPDHIFVRIRFELAIITGNNQPIFHDVLTGYSVVGVVQLGNSAHEMAFVEAMNQINDQVHEAAVATRQLFDDRGSGPSGSARSKSTGTGIVVSASGALVTNHHVVADCDVITVSRAGRESSAQLIFADSRNDLAVLQADADIGRPVVLRGGLCPTPRDSNPFTSRHKTLTL